MTKRSEPFQVVARGKLVQGAWPARRERSVRRKVERLVQDQVRSTAALSSLASTSRALGSVRRRETLSGASRFDARAFGAFELVELHEHLAVEVPGDETFRTVPSGCQGQARAWQQ